MYLRHYGFHASNGHYTQEMYTRQSNERVDAINELLISSNPKKNKLLTLLKQLPDVEKGLCRIYYGRVKKKK